MEAVSTVVVNYGQKKRKEIRTDENTYLSNLKILLGLNRHISTNTENNHKTSSTIEGIGQDCYVGCFTKICRENSSFVKPNKNNGPLMHSPLL
jgi:hypothetical protein